MTSESIEREGLLPIGTTLAGGRYRIEGHLASGGFGNTYVATKTAFDEKVAIKELFIRGVCGRNDNTRDITVSLTENRRTFETQREKFRKEALRLHHLNNPHIVKVDDLFDENETSYYVMDFVEGESLSARLKRLNRPLSESEWMLLLPQVLDALEAVHANGMWHLDLKPANIMVDKLGNALLIDFGASKQLRNSDGQSLSTSSALAYTPGYASSEQMEQNIEKFGPWTDLYSLGATMFNLLTRKQPPSPSDIDEDPDEVLRLPDGISHKTRELVMWLMKPNRKMRPQSVADVRQYLDEAAPQGPSEKKAGDSDRETDDRDDQTKLKESRSATSRDEESEAKPQTTAKKGATFRFAVIVVAVLACVTVFGFIMKGTKTSSNTPGPDSVAVSAAVPVKSVTDMPVTVAEGPDNMRNYLYTGSIEDTEGALPQGEGTARFEKYGSIPAATYTGRFEDGICQDLTGNASLVFTSGDKYVGTFEKGYYGEGTYTMADGSYFKGTFRKGAPWDGAWYNANGSFSAKVVNGQEQ